ncbi:MAG: hypothetical protein ACYCPT_03805 [Acidimicrobiales bacterium]
MNVSLYINVILIIIIIYLLYIGSSTKEADKKAKPKKDQIDILIESIENKQRGMQ